MKLEKYINGKLWLIPIVGMLLAFASLPFLPDQIPLHWDGAGNIDRMATKFSVLLPSIICMVILLNGNITPIINPKKEAYANIVREYNIIHLMVVLMLFVLQIVITAISLGISVNINSIASIMVGILLVIVGNYLPKIPQNYLTGIKTIWGYHNEEIWRKTQALAGKIWFIAGLILIGTAFITTNDSVSGTILIIIFLVVIPRIYGLLLSRKHAQ